jgi:hypothetical protein
MQWAGVDFRKLFSNNHGMAKEPPKHGGKRKGAGRKPKPPGERRGQVFSIKLTLDEKRLLEEADARTWARDILIKTAKKRSQK